MKVTGDLLIRIVETACSGRSGEARSMFSIFKGKPEDFAEMAKANADAYAALISQMQSGLSRVSEQDR